MGAGAAVWRLDSGQRVRRRWLRGVEGKRRSMKTCEYDGQPFAEPRSHPWMGASDSPTARYYDFKAEPARIRTVLEDFLPWSHEPAVIVLYELLERLNGLSSHLESNDCAFNAPHDSEAPQLGKLQCDGRVMVLFRELELNLSQSRIEGLKNALHRCLVELDSKFELGMIGTTITPVLYLELPGAREDRLGHQLMISFWAWGDVESEVMRNLERVLENLSQALGSLATAA
jgi:hypothetical protein